MIHVHYDPRTIKPSLRRQSTAAMDAKSILRTLKLAVIIAMIVLVAVIIEL